MSILIVDDSADSLLLLEAILKKAGYKDITLAASVREAFDILKVDDPSKDASIDLILMDVMMPEIDGIEACRRIKEKEFLHDIPIIMVTAVTGMEKLEMAFSCGAADYITKPVKKIELLARVRSVLRFKSEMDQRKAHERELEGLTKQLEAANKILEHLAILDGLTGIANRRYFDEFIDQEWLRAIRDQAPISLIMIDIDHFKAFNDTYGHQKGDECLKMVADVLREALKRPADLIARYGGEEFAAVLPETDIKGAVALAEIMRSDVESLMIPHAGSRVADHVTISLGSASTVPERNSSPSRLIAEADKSLYKAKENGRNRVETRWSEDITKAGQGI